MNTETKTMMGVGLVCLLLLIGGGWLYQKTSPKDTLVVNQEFLVRDDSLKVTATSSKVTVVEFADYQCPACAYIAPGIEELKEKYKDSVNFVYRDFPLNIHKNAIKATQMSYIANEQGKYWEMHSKLYAGQTEWSELGDPSDVFIGYARDIGMKTENIKEKLSSDIYKDRIDRDVKDGELLGVNSTPTFFVNSTIIRVASYDAIRQAIDAELEKAK